MKNRKIIKLSAGILIMTAIPICSQNNLSRVLLSEEHTEREITFADDELTDTIRILEKVYDIDGNLKSEETRYKFDETNVEKYLYGYNEDNQMIWSQKVVWNSVFDELEIEKLKYEYDSDGKLAYRIKENGTRIKYIYNNKGLLIEERDADSMSEEEHVQYDYDSKGRKIEEKNFFTKYRFFYLDDRYYFKSSYNNLEINGELEETNFYELNEHNDCIKNVDFTHTIFGVDTVVYSSYSYLYDNRGFHVISNSNGGSFRIWEQIGWRWPKYDYKALRNIISGPQNNLISSNLISRFPDNANCKVSYKEVKTGNVSTIVSTECKAELSFPYTAIGNPQLSLKMDGNCCFEFLLAVNSLIDSGQQINVKTVIQESIGDVVIAPGYITVTVKSDTENTFIWRVDCNCNEMINDLRLYLKDGKALIDKIKDYIHKKTIEEAKNAAPKFGLG